MPAYDSKFFDPPAPLARVSLKALNNGAIVTDVPMLIDSGADVTLIPRTFINELKLELDQNESYELASFDGHKSTGAVGAPRFHISNTNFPRSFPSDQLGKWDLRKKCSKSICTRP